MQLTNFQQLQNDKCRQKEQKLPEKYDGTGPTG